MGKIYVNGIDFSAPVITGNTEVKGDQESTYRTGKVNITPSNIFRTRSIQKSMILTTDWQDVDLSGVSLTTGTYIVTVTSETDGKYGLWSETYSGLMHWYAEHVNSAESDEILLHSSGHAPNGSRIYLRTKRNSTGLNKLTLQIAFTKNETQEINLTFDFRRIL